MKINKTLLLALTLTAACCAQPAFGMSWLFGTSEPKKQYYTPWGEPCGETPWQDESVKSKGKPLRPVWDDTDWPSFHDPVKSVVKLFTAILNFEDTPKQPAYNPKYQDVKNLEELGNQSKVALVYPTLKESKPEQSTSEFQQELNDARAEKITMGIAARLAACKKIDELMSMMDLETRLEVLKCKKALRKLSLEDYAHYITQDYHLIADLYKKNNNEHIIDPSFMKSKLAKTFLNKNSSPIYKTYITNLYKKYLIELRVKQITTIYPHRLRNTIMENLLLKNPIDPIASHVTADSLNQSAKEYLYCKFTTDEEKGHLYTFAKKNNVDFILNCYKALDNKILWENVKWQ